MTKNMFTHEDLPLFSGTPQAGKDPAFTPKDEPQQQTLYACPICHDTGQMPWYYDTNKTKELTCFCDAGKDQ